MLKKVLLLNSIFILLLNSCNIFELDDDEVISLSYDLNFSENRTINSTSFSSDVNYIVIEGWDTDSNIIYEILDYNSDYGTISGLTNDTWEIYVTAWDINNNLLAYGEDKSVDITSGSSNTISITMEYSKSITGDISITVEWSENANVDYFIATINDPSENTTTYGSTDNGSDDYIDVSALTSYTFMASGIESGSSTLFLQFYYTDETEETIIAFSVTEAVMVYDNLTTEATITLTDSDIGVPDAPTNIEVTGVTTYSNYDDSIGISWDSVTNADYYQVYYSYEPVSTVWADSYTVDLTSYFTVTDDYYYSYSYTNSETVEIEIPTAEDDYIYSYVNDESCNMIITFTVSAINDYGESLSDPIIYTTTVY